MMNDGSCYNSSLLVNMKDLDRLKSFLYRLFWRRPLLLLSFLPRRLDDVIHTQ